MACLGPCGAVEVDGAAKAVGFAPYHGYHQGKTKQAGAHEGFRGSAHADPNGHFSLKGTGVHRLVVQCRTEFTRPGYAFLGPQLEEQIEFFGKQRVVVVEVKAKQREGLGK